MTSSIDSIEFINDTGHDPEGKLDYAIPLSDYLRSGEILTSLSWASYESDGVTTTDPPFEIHADTQGTPQAASVTEGGVTYTSCEIVWLNVEGADKDAKEARAGQTGVITLSFSTNQSRDDHRSFKLTVKHR